ncbi:Membrane protein involved in the export of O-antigen and teichoic acid [Devosia crocina]|uniref:Membrane protein involved in the export of O-antigen and teichoic acid n=1 Tax=Devosia crocina TaxID=429728 RepID=A0A1I7N1K4_9HYPH|nr:oligosaccharide flippase family protein [Devosia crocina]SFV28523.1 Membrane protein involved in the export of O-antigen and teichoic acid [Devosia crocina]
MVRRPVRLYVFSLAAMLVPALAQFVLFAIYARVLGLEAYGVYVALLSWAPLCFELVGWGAGDYLVKRTTQNPLSFSAARAHMRKMLGLTILPAAALFALATALVIGDRISPAIIFAIGLCELGGLRLIVNAEQSALALGRLSHANRFRLMQALPRLPAVLLALHLGFISLEALALASAAGLLVTGLAAASIAAKLYPPAPSGALLAEGLRDGTWFMGSQMVRAGQHNVDRVVLSALVDPATLALYGVAQRFVQMGLLPLQAVLRLTYPRFFAEGRGGMAPTLRFALIILPVVLLVAIASAGGLLVGGMAIPLLLGAQFGQATLYLAHLAPILVLFALQSLTADALSGAGYLRARTLLIALGVGLQALGFLLWHEGLEIVLASYAGLAASVLLTVSTVLLIVRAESRRRLVVPA